MINNNYKQYKNNIETISKRKRKRNYNQTPLNEFIPIQVTFKHRN